MNPEEWPFQKGEIVHRKHYRPDVQGHIFDCYVKHGHWHACVFWDINRPRHHADASNMRASRLVSDGVYQEPAHLAVIETPHLDPLRRERIIREVVATEPWLLQALVFAPSADATPWCRDRYRLRMAHLSHLRQELAARSRLKRSEQPI